MAAHTDSGWRCLVAHYKKRADGTREMLPACIVCKTCGTEIRPEKMHEECTGKK